MSASAPPPEPGRGNSGPTPDPSMEDILASIRRILSEDEQSAQQPPSQPGEPASAAPLPAPEEPDVLALDELMLVAEPPDAPLGPPSGPPHDPSPGARADDPATDPSPLANPDDEMTALIAAMSPPGEPLESEPVPAPPPERAAERLIAPEVEAATTSSVSSLLRTLEAGRGQAGTLPVYRGGPTLEDMVRDEMRPLLKAWLDSNLPPLVERLVRAEIERLIGRAVG